LSKKSCRLGKKLKQELQAVLLSVTFIDARENQILSSARVQRGVCDFENF